MLTESETIMYRRMSELHHALRKTLDRVNHMLDIPDLVGDYAEEQLGDIKRELEELLYDR